MDRFPWGMPDKTGTGLDRIGFGSVKTGPIDQGRQRAVSRKIKMKIKKIAKQF
jgi:hypothetical protein